MKLPGFLRRNIRLKLLATGVAFVSWVGVVYAGNPPETKTVSVPVPQSPSAIPAQFVLVNPVPNLQVRIGGTRDSLNSFNVSALTVSVAWKSVTRAGVVNVPVTITDSDPGVQLVDPPKYVSADLDTLASATLPVNINVTSLPPAGYLVSSEAASPASVVVAGAQHELPGLQARVKVDLGNRKTNVEADVPVLIYDSHDVQVTNLSSIDPSTVRVTITVAASQTSRASAVVPSTTGTVAPGHQFAGIRVNPATVALSGPQDLLNALDSVSTATISLNGLTGTVTVNVPVKPPDGVSAQPGTVAVTVNVVTVATPTPAPTATPTPVPTPTPSTTP